MQVQQLLLSVGLKLAIKQIVCALYDSGQCHSQTLFFLILLYMYIHTPLLFLIIINLISTPPLPSRYGASTKAAVIRIGLLEMWRFIRIHFNGKDMSTLLESCGVADLIATCSGGRNRKVSEAFVKTGKVSDNEG